VDKNIHKLLLGFTSIILFFCIPAFALAQVGFEPIEEPLYVRVFPEFPRANEDFSITIDSFSVDIDSAEIAWFENGILKEEGVGNVRYTGKTGALGSRTVVQIAVTARGTPQLQEEVVIVPGNVSLLWEAQTYTPPFYLGKALPSSQSEIKVVAKPSLVNPQTGAVPRDSDLIYTWYENDRVLGAHSGYGKNTITALAPLPGGRYSLGVKVTTASEAVSAYAETTILDYTPLVRFYEEDPLIGKMGGKALKSPYFVQTSEQTIVAEPFFFSVARPENETLSYSWFINDEPLVISGGRPHALTLAVGPDVTGEADVNLRIQNLGNIFQTLQDRITVYFGASSL